MRRLSGFIERKKHEMDGDLCRFVRRGRYSYPMKENRKPLSGGGTSRFPRGLVPLTQHTVIVDIDFRWSFRMLSSKEPVHTTVLLTAHTIAPAFVADEKVLYQQIDTCRQALEFLPGPPVFSDARCGIDVYGNPKDALSIIFSRISIPKEIYEDISQGHRDYLAFISLLPVWSAWHFSDPTIKPQARNPVAVAEAVERCIAGQFWNEAINHANRRFRRGVKG